MQKEKNIELIRQFTAREMLGVKADSNMDLLEKVERGLPFQTAVRLGKVMGISLDTVRTTIGIAHRTFSRRKFEKKFSTEESDRIVSLSRLFASVLRLFEGDAAAARDWLSNPNHALGSRTPLEIATTETGTREIESLIGRIEHGVFT